MEFVDGKLTAFAEKGKTMDIKMTQKNAGHGGVPGSAGPQGPTANNDAGAVGDDGTTSRSHVTAMDVLYLQTHLLEASYHESFLSCLQQS